MASDSRLNCRPHPAVYRIYLEQYSKDQLFCLYSNEILIGARISEVKAAIVEYVSQNIEPVGWQAVWRGTKRSSGLPVECDFLVEVFDVSLDKLHATVGVLALLECHGADTAKESSELELLMNSSNDICIPLIELYPVSEGDEEEIFYFQTAITIEHVRCFYKYLWRPWDEDDDDDAVFSEKYLRHRLKFFLDLKNEVIPESLAMQAESILHEGWKIHHEIDSITQDNDFEQELDEEEVRKVIQLRLKLEELQKEMELMENPIVRALAVKTGAATSTKNKNAASHTESVFHIVGTSFSFGKVKGLDLDESDSLEFHHNIEEAISCASAMDIVLIFPGTYKCGALNWLESDILIRGLGTDASHVVLEGFGGSGDFFINSNTPCLQLENLTLRPAKDVIATVIVHSGQILMHSCIIYGGNSCLVLLPEAEAKATSCEFLSAKVDGIQLRIGSSLELNECKIHHCKNSGILLNSSTHRKETDNITVLIIDESNIEQNNRHSLLLECHPNDDSINEDVAWDEINKVPWLDVTTTGTCQLGAIGLKYLEPIKKSIISPPADYLRFMESVETKHLHWSHDELEDTVKAFAFEDSPNE